jgi:hypothetical protein
MDLMRNAPQRPIASVPLWPAARPSRVLPWYCGQPAGAPMVESAAVLQVV